MPNIKRKAVSKNSLGTRDREMVDPRERIFHPACVPSSRSELLHELLRERFGMEQFRGLQQEVIETLLAGKSALALFPTGAGKSLCYQLPALLLDGLTLVVSPLIALMNDQVESLHRRGIPAARIDSTLADDEVDQVLHQARSGRLPLLFLSPERLASRDFRKQLRGVPIRMLAIDEAHCVSEWGHNFRPDFLKIARLARRLKAERILALTATATPKVAREIRKQFRIAKSCQFDGGCQRPNLMLRVEALSDLEKDQRLIAHLHSHDGPAIVYATARQDTERLAALLQKNGLSASAYHAGLPAATRAAIQEAFLANRTRIIAATIAFGMGIDKADIRSVIHYHLPKSIEGYTQETGRAGRDGLPSTCLLFANLADAKTLENFIHAATPSPQSLRNLLDRLLRLTSPGKPFAISPYDLSLGHDLREETLRTVLAYLELDDIIERCGQFRAYFRVRLLRPLDHVLAGYPPRTKLRIRRLFDAAEEAYGSLHFRLYEITARCGLSREQAAEIIISLADAGDIRLEQRSLHEVYRLSKTTPFTIATVIDAMLARFVSRAAFEFDRIRGMRRYVESRNCRALYLARHFGSTMAACGTCDLCQGAAALRLRAPKTSPISDAEWNIMLALRAEQLAALATPRQLARFLCGISSPASFQSKLQQRREFGLWQHRDFLEVLALLEA
jgi:ATP-dependent DNA helicase RecQ